MLITYAYNLSPLGFSGVFVKRKSHERIGALENELAMLLRIDAIKKLVRITITLAQTVFLRCTVFYASFKRGHLSRVVRT